MTNYDWIRWLFHVIPIGTKVREPTEYEHEVLCKGLENLRNGMKDSDESSLMWNWSFTENDTPNNMFKYSSREIHWWLDPKEAMVITNNIDADKFLEWSKTEYERMVKE